ncbi:hypothetical protein PACTADRAFT_37270 [Pachysolen tannophilus NRRL Y-2460]|uniref:Phosphoribosylglycinamide formyltransferase n=1 Tax=Pachysolen tannophilus NRRL Y-2460 TaxID=669874 RepID=A0A1E4U394_PACTA|nr:hypothetical protein PACTADRAFT_37270 [Pachysolen tannophilus NRRL Y-2460]
MSSRNILVLISGNGSNLQALIDASLNGELPAKISWVISSSSTAYGLERASNASIPTAIHELKNYYKDIPKSDKKARSDARKKFNLDLVNLILNDKKNGKPDLIVCAGWMLILSPDFLAPLEKAKIPIINLHPSLPGKFDGINAIERSYKAGQEGEIDEGGCMIHKVIQEVDAGEPLVVKKINVVKGESLESWENRIHQLEHVAIVEGTIKALQELI